MRVSAKERWEVIERIKKLGITETDAIALRRIALTLHRWFELECGDGYGHIERDETTGRPYYVNHRKTVVPDREAGAKKRLEKILAHYPGLTPYIQTDPRGASLYLLTADTVQRYNQPLDQCYNHGTAIY